MVKCITPPCNNSCTWLPEHHAFSSLSTLPFASIRVRQTTACRANPAHQPVFVNKVLLSSAIAIHLHIVYALMLVAVMSDGNRDQMACKVKKYLLCGSGSLPPSSALHLFPTQEAPCRVSPTPSWGHLPGKAHRPPCPHTARLAANQWLGQTGSHSQASLLLFVCSWGMGVRRAHPWSWPFAQMDRAP